MNVTKRLTIDVREAAGLLGISSGLAYDLARRGELPGARRLGNRVVVVRAELERFLDGDGPTQDGDAA